MIPNTTITTMGISALLIFLLPIVTAIICRHKFHIQLIPVVVGCGLFILFAQILERTLHQLVLHPATDGTSQLQNNSPWLYVLYAAFAAGIFEETARFIGFKILKKKYHGLGTAIGYGIGHGGIEALLVALTVFQNLMIALSVNANNQTVIHALPKAALQQFINTSSSTFLLSFVERVPAFLFHICMSILVWIAVTQVGKKGFFPLAILFHALFDAPVGMMQAGLLHSGVVLYVILYAETALILLFVLHYWKHNKQVLQLA